MLHSQQIWSNQTTERHRTLNSPPPINTLSIWLRVEQFPIKKKTLKAEWQSHIRHMRRKPHGSGYDRLGHNLSISSTPGIASDRNWEPLLKAVKSSKPHQAPQPRSICYVARVKIGALDPCKSSLLEMNELPKYLALKTNGTHILKSTRL